MISEDALKQLVEYSKKLKILYVEDSLEAREQALKLLNNFFSTITIAVDGQDGLDKFSQDNFDLIFSDLNMPVMGGIEMIENIRLTNTTISIVVISAHNESSFKKETQQYNVCDYLIKPVSLDKFIDILVNIKNKS